MYEMGMSLEFAFFDFEMTRSVCKYDGTEICIQMLYSYDIVSYPKFIAQKAMYPYPTFLFACSSNISNMFAIKWHLLG